LPSARATASTSRAGAWPCNARSTVVDISSERGAAAGSTVVDVSS
jgi:hypothetical protein